jgi:hypothetical protein
MGSVQPRSFATGEGVFHQSEGTLLVFTMSDALSSSLRQALFTLPILGVGVVAGRISWPAVDPNFWDGAGI